MTDQLKALIEDKIKKAIESCKETEWGYNGEDEYPFEVFDSKMALHKIMEIIKQILEENEPRIIEKLKALEPTEGEWDDSYGIIECNDVALFDRRSATTSDCQLITLAPQMRLAILDMAKEIEELKNFIRLKCITPNQK